MNTGRRIREAIKACMEDEDLREEEKDEGSIRRMTEQATRIAPYL